MVEIFNNISYEYDVKDQFDAKWLKIFEHNSTDHTFFNKNDQNEVLLNKNSIKQYSIIKYLSRIRKFNSSYEFLIEYPEYLKENDAYVHWRQNINPLEIYQWIDKEKPEDFEYDILHLPTITDNCKKIVFQGLVRSNQDDWQRNSTYLLGVGGYPNWFYSIGAFTKWTFPDTFPGPGCLNATNNIVTMLYVHHVKLWIRIQEYHNLFVHQCTCQEKYTHIKYSALFISLYFSEL